MKRLITFGLIVFALIHPLMAQDKVLTGFIVKSGDIVDGVIPLYKELQNGVPSGQEIQGKAVGSVQTSDRRLAFEGYYVSGLRYQKGDYFGHSVIAWMEVEFSPVTKMTQRFGSNRNTRNVGAPIVLPIGGGANLDIQAGQYVSDFSVSILSGFRINAGDVVDSVTPIFQPLSSDGTLGEPRLGERWGGSGGDARDVIFPGWVVESVRYQKCLYYGHSAIGWLEVNWEPRDATSLQKRSEKLGANQYVRNRSIETQSVLNGEEYFTRVEGQSGFQYMSALTLR